MGEGGRSAVGPGSSGASLPAARALLCLLAALPSSLLFGADWPQAAGGPERTAHVSDEPRPPYKLAWTRYWKDEVLLNTNQPIAVGGVLYIGSVQGRVHAVKLADGNELWSADLGTEILHALASDGERIFAAGMDGAFHALDRDTGEVLWTAKLSRRGFSVGPLVMDGMVMAGCRDGVFYAARADSGELAWKFATEAPIDQTAAGSGGKVVFVNDAMRVLCLEAGSGRRVWEKTVPGRSVRDYWPVIHRDRVIIRTAEPGPSDLSGKLQALQKRFFWPIAWGPPPKGAKILFRAKSEDDMIKERDAVSAFYREHPDIRTCFVLSLEDGGEPCIAGLTAGCRNTGVPPPPVLAGDGSLYTTFRTSAANRGFIDITHCAVGRLDLTTGKITKPVLCGYSEVGKVLGVSTPFELTSDETVTMTSGGNWIFGNRAGGGFGAVHVGTRRTARLPVPSLPRTTGNMQSAGNMIAVSGKYVFFTLYRQVVCIRGS